MNKNSKLFTIPILLLWLASAISISAQFRWDNPPEHRWFLKGDVGGNWMQDADVQQFLLPDTPRGKVTFDPGLRFGFNGGYNFTDWFSLDAEIGFYYNSIDTIPGADYVDVSFLQVPLLVNARFQLPTTTPFIPYIGAGVGGSSAILDINQMYYGPYWFWGSDTDFVFAYQAFAGVRYTLNEEMSLGIEYRFLAAESPSWDSGYPWIEDMTFGDTKTHSLSISFQYSF